jgi:hypothetical protein
MKIAISISWKMANFVDLMIAKSESFDLLFRSHDIRPPDPETKKKEKKQHLYLLKYISSWTRIIFVN